MPPSHPNMVTSGSKKNKMVTAKMQIQGFKSWRFVNFWSLEFAFSGWCLDCYIHYLVYGHDLIWRIYDMKQLGDSEVLTATMGHYALTQRGIYCKLKQPITSSCLRRSEQEHWNKHNEHKLIHLVIHPCRVFGPEHTEETLLTHCQLGVDTNSITTSSTGVIQV